MTTTTYERWIRIGQAVLAIVLVMISAVLAWAALSEDCRNNREHNLRQDRRIERIERRMDAVGETLHRMDKRQAIILEKVNKLEIDP